MESFSLYTSIVTETPSAVTVISPPSQVQNVMITKNGTSLTVSWTPVSDPVHVLLYVVRYSTDSGTETEPPPDAMKRSGITDTSTILTGLESNTTYFVWVSAEIRGAGVQGPYSLSVSSGSEIK